MNVIISSAQRQAYTFANEGKSDHELKIYILSIAEKIQSIPKNLSPAHTLQAEELLAEMQVCKEILEDRQNKKVRLEAAHKKWDDSLKVRRYAAVRNLKYAVSPNGQLVAAILEDEGALRKKELSTWCDELEALGDAELDDLLSALVKEGIITVHGDTYSLEMICIESLFPEDPVAWGKAKLGKNCREEDELILTMLLLNHSAICKEDFPGILSSDTRLLARSVRKMWEDYPAEERKLKLNQYKEILKDKKITDSILDRLPLSDTTIEGFHMLYFPMMGEKV